jgi:tetratricopeptide (TPR) repeat protein
MNTLSEKLFRAMDRAKGNRDFKDEAELQTFMNQFVGKNIDELVAGQQLAPEDQAQEWALDAQEAPSEAAALDLLERALALDPGCCDALVQLAFLKYTTAAELIRRLGEAAALEEARLGKAFFKEHKGHFWGFHETRPFMRALYCQAETLFAAGRLEEAKKIFTRMIQLNPGDNQGVRAPLGPLTLLLGDLKGYRVLRNKFKGSADLELLWCDVLEAFLMGILPDAALRYERALAANGYMPAYLKGHRKLPRHLPDSYEFGSPEEAIGAAYHLLPAWNAYPKARRWLEGMKAR